MRETNKLWRARGSGRAQQEGKIRVQLMPRARPPLLKDRAPVAGPQNDVGVVGRNQGFQGGGLVLGQEDKGVSAHQGRQIGDERFHVVGCGQRDEATFGTQPDGQIIDAFRQLPVGQRQSVGEDGGSVPVARKIGGKGHPHEIKLRGHSDDDISLGLPKPN